MIKFTNFKYECHGRVALLCLFHSERMLARMVSHCYRLEEHDDPSSGATTEH